MSGHQVVYFLTGPFSYSSYYEIWLENLYGTILTALMCAGATSFTPVITAMNFRRPGRKLSRLL
jgi:hypothetical protein